MISLLVFLNQHLLVLIVNLGKPVGTVLHYTASTLSVTRLHTFIMRSSPLRITGHAMLYVFKKFAVTQGRSRSLKWQYSVDRIRVSYCRFIVTMAISCIISEIKRDICRKSRFFIAHLHSKPPLGRPNLNTAMTFGVETLEWRIYQMVTKVS